ncbi:hypothetical protein Alches_01800 [Alicyclobacillus hesperidum subsp. aegles]|uniref:sugar phosphate isomerase/epimerase family protein n=1 Tax=Alicyclobacillus hesperidum TaxID=89784 RepID=UPI0007193151|nr:sugar phosphate isomerase/epimerase [Alicyclobacillus hesperidum]KRW91343.1 hypothetical protein SD51_09790 [Alicyclobacillus tengchongensis]GLG00141.1 hypothetical protein Alches_01800 [Alicyclobacillus hesperidum subsp. aegles]
MRNLIGARLSPQLQAQGIKFVADQFREMGLTAIDLPSLQYVQTAEDGDLSGLELGTVDLAGVSGLLSPHAQEREQAMASVCRQIEELAAFGAKTAFVCLVPQADRQPISESLDYFTETFPVVAEVCERHEVRIAIEGWPGPAPYYPTLGYTPEVWREMFHRVRSPYIGLCYDPSHLVRLGIDYLRVLDEFQDRIFHCHGKDTEILKDGQYLYGGLPARLSIPERFSEGSWRYCIPGTGEVNWGKIASKLSRIGYGACVSIELEDIRFWGSAEDELHGIQCAFRHLAQYFA